MTAVPATHAIIATIITLSISNGIQNLKITDLCGQILSDSSMDPALLAGVDDADDEDTSFAGVHDKDTSIPVPNMLNTTVMTNDDTSDGGSNHNSINPNEDNDNSSKASVHSTRSHLSIHSATSEPRQHPLDVEHPPYEEDNLSKDQAEQDNEELPKLETQVPVLC